MNTLHVGFDDTDSPSKGCTTYVAARLVEALLDFNVVFIDYPNLVRLNPNVPWKTRGNGALCLRVQYDEADFENIRKVVVETVRKNADLDCEETDPGIVFLKGNNLSPALREFSRQTVRGVVTLKDAYRLAKVLGAEVVSFKRGRGIIGAMGAMGEPLRGDYTYEIIAYRTSNNRGKPRRIQVSSVKKMDAKTKPFTYNNLDYEKDRIIITPRGPDPILYGIRGESAEIVKRAHGMVVSREPIERWVIFRSNQGTDSHFAGARSIIDVNPFQPAVVQGAVVKTPWIVPRRHVIFSIKDKTGEISCAAFEPTGELRKAAQKLVAGDLIEAYGGVNPPSPKHGLTLNLEKFKVLKLNEEIKLVNPSCIKCGKRMGSMGFEKGFKCKGCGFRSTKMRKQAYSSRRVLKEGTYITSTRSQRHLAKPRRRYGHEKKEGPRYMVKEWFGH